MNEVVPTSMEPIGEANPLLKQNIAESAGATSSFTDTFKAVAALKIRAPSICRERLFVRATSATIRIIRRQWDPAANVLGIFKADQTRDGVMHILGPDGGENIL